MTVAATSALLASRNCSVDEDTVAASIASLNVTVRFALGATPVAPDTGAVAVTVGAVVSGPRLVTKTGSTQ